MSDDILSLIDNAVEDWETSDDAMRWTPKPPTPPPRSAPVRRAREPAEPPRQRVVDEPRDGYRLTPFIGGPLDGDLRRLPRDVGYAWNVPVPPPMPFAFDEMPDLIADPGYVTYHIHRIWLDLPVYEFLGLYRPWRGRAAVCVMGGQPDEYVLRRAVEVALSDGWKPWDYSQT